MGNHDAVEHGPERSGGQGLDRNQLESGDRAILALHLQGHTIAEIKAHTGRAMRTIRRVLERIRKQVRTIQADEG